MFGAKGLWSHVGMQLDKHYYASARFSRALLPTHRQDYSSIAVYRGEMVRSGALSAGLVQCHEFWWACLFKKCRWALSSKM